MAQKSPVTAEQPKASKETTTKPGAARGPQGRENHAQRSADRSEQGGQPAGSDVEPLHQRSDHHGAREREPASSRHQGV